MDDPAAVEGVEIPFLQSHARAQIPSGFGDAIGVAFDVQVLGLNGRRETEDHLLRAVQAVVHRLQAQSGPDPGDQPEALDRLRHEVVCAPFQRHAAGVSAATNREALPKRSIGDLAGPLRSASSTWLDSSPTSSRVGGTALLMCDSRTAAGVSASNGTRPVSIS